MSEFDSTARSSEPAIAMEGVCKRFGSNHVLNEVKLEVPSGCVFSILGENGAGKTTLIRILLGLTKADRGHIKMLGSMEPFRSKQQQARIGYVPDRPELHDWMTVAETGWFLAGFFDDHYLDRYRQSTAEFGLPEKTKVKDLSKGMRAKVAWSLALAKDPDLLILDEPTSGLDSLIRREVMEKMVDLAAQGKTIFLCSHQIHEVERVTDYVAVLHGGRFQVAERLEKLKHNYHDCRITFREITSQPPRVNDDATLLSQLRRGRQWKLLVRGDSPEALGIERWQNDSQVESVEVLTPNLEEIYCALLRPGDVDATHSNSTNETPNASGTAGT